MTNPKKKLINLIRPSLVWGRLRAEWMYMITFANKRRKKGWDLYECPKKNNLVKEKNERRLVSQPKPQKRRETGQLWERKRERALIHFLIRCFLFVSLPDNIHL
jgi:hypothetical protein